MEHRTLTPSITTAWRELTLETYRSLGSVATTELIEEGDLRGMGSDFPHPIANFILVERLTHAEGVRLAELQETFPSLCVNVIRPLDDPDSAETDHYLRFHGFRCFRRLALMARDGAVDESSPGPAWNVSPAEDDVTRTRAADFMVRQFFPSQADAVRDVLVRGLVECPFGTMHRVTVREELVGACVTFAHPGTAEFVALFNLCVRNSARRKGIGRALVRTAMGSAPCLLQSSHDLAPWYQAMGFRVVGSVDLWSA